VSEAADDALAFDVAIEAGGRRWRHAATMTRPGTLVLFGASGAGKTLTLRALAGLARPTAGRIRCGPRTLFDAAADIDVRPQDRAVGYVPQHGALFPYLTVRGNVGFGVPRAERDERTAALLRQLGLDGLANRRPESLSGGERQRVAVARALARGPQLLLLDEPFSALDRTARRELRAWFDAHVRAHALVVVLVTHDADEALALGDRLVLVDGGAAIAEGRPADVLARAR
jgi:ABC-type sulfate/molybdate transport systems ATPase subunit